MWINAQGCAIIYFLNNFYKLKGTNQMIKLVIALTFHLSTPATILTYDYGSMAECLNAKQDKVVVLDSMNLQSIIVGYSAVCK